jgi:hypothetical protein
MRRCSGQYIQAARLAITAACAMLLTASAIQAATFGPISGSLSIRAGSHAPQNASAIIGTASLTDIDLPTAAASASLVTSIPNASRFKYSGAARSTTNTAVTVIPPNATASTNFSQSFTTTGQQWIDVNANVLSPADPGVSAFVTFGRTGQAPLYIIPGTGGGGTVRSNLYAAGSYTISGVVNTQATIAPAHAGAVSGYVLIAAMGDFNGNQVVDGADLNALRTNFGAKTGTFASGSLDGDMDTDGADFLLLQRQLGTHSLAVVASAAVPEPTSVILAACGLALLHRTRRQTHCRTKRSAARRAAMSPAK